MAQNPSPRRFYIDRSEDRAVVRTVPVRRTPPATPTPATHQVTPITPVDSSQPLMHTALETKRSSARASVASRLAPKRVSKLVQPARKRTNQSPS